MPLQKRKRQTLLLIILILSDRIYINCQRIISKSASSTSEGKTLRKSKDSEENLVRFARDVSQQSNNSKREVHLLVEYKGWQCLSFLGLLGTCANLLLIGFFYSEPSMATSVNSMIFMETIYRVAYTLTIQWRTFNIVQDETLFTTFLTREEVWFECDRLTAAGYIGQVTHIFDLL